MALLPVPLGRGLPFEAPCRVQKDHPSGPCLQPRRSCLRLVRALAVEMDENWLEAQRQLNMEAHRYRKVDDLREHKEEALRIAA